MYIQEEVALTFDDVLLKPRRSTMNSRFNGEIDLSTCIAWCGNKQIVTKYPIISANMDTVTDIKMAKALQELGGLGIIHRFMTPQDQLVQLKELGYQPIICIGVGQEGRDRLTYITNELDLAQTNAGILIDIAHGHSDIMIDQIKWCKDKYPEVPLIAGNIATAEAALDLIDAGADCLKIGVGPGSLCETRGRTGAGVPQLSAIIEVYRAAKQVNRVITLIADGGIKNSGDAVKALAAGANSIMMGNFFAGTYEAPGQILEGPSGKMKVFRGMASKAAQEDWKGYATSVEGEITWLPFKGSVKHIFNELINGMLSGMSYQAAHNLSELHSNAVFIKQTSAGYKESIPHGKL